MLTRIGQKLLSQAHIIDLLTYSQLLINMSVHFGFVLLVLTQH